MADNAQVIVSQGAVHKFLPQLHALLTIDRQREDFHHLQLPDAG
jgi:hypothetical protein